LFWVVTSVNITMVTVKPHPSNCLEPPSNHIATYTVEGIFQLHNIVQTWYAIMYNTLATEFCHCKRLSPHLHFGHSF